MVMTLPLLLLIQDAEHAVEAGGLPAPFQPTIGLVIWTWVVFIALLIILAKFVYPGLVKMTADREATINQQLAEAKRLQAEAEAGLEEQRALLAGARGEAQAIVGEARDAAERERASAVARTRTEQEEILTRAKQEIAAEGERAKAEMRREAVDLAIAAAGKVIGRQLDADADRKLVEDYLSEIGSQA
jgi:F-type H+-transporting ATPase subunit b